MRFSVIEGAGTSTGGGGENVVMGNGNGAATVTTHYNLRVGFFALITDRLSDSDSDSVLLNHCHLILACKRKNCLGADGSDT